MPAETSSFAEDASSATFTTVPGEADYDAIFAAVMETDRGRWFLIEYARRNRQADTAAVLTAIDRLGTSPRPDLVGVPSDQPQCRRSGADVHRLRIELADMASAIARTKSELGSIRPDATPGDRIMEATGQADSLVQGPTGRAMSDILAAAERVRDVAWMMREQDMDSKFCDQLDDCAAKIHAACSFQDMTGRRARKIVQVLRYLEARIQSMTDICGAEAPLKR